MLRSSQNRLIHLLIHVFYKARFIVVLYQIILSAFARFKLTLLHLKRKWGSRIECRNNAFSDKERRWVVLFTFTRRFNGGGQWTKNQNLKKKKYSQLRSISAILSLRYIYAYLYRICYSRREKWDDENYWFTWSGIVGGVFLNTCFLQRSKMLSYIKSNWTPALSRFTMKRMWSPSTIL